MNYRGVIFDFNGVLVQDSSWFGRASLSPGAEDLLEFLVIKNIPRAIATSASPDDMRRATDQLNLGRWFASGAIVCTDGTLPGKPAPDVYLEAAKRIEVPIGECVIIEDSLAGIRGARAAQTGKVIGLGAKERHVELLQSGAHSAIENLGAIGLREFEE